MQVRIERPDLPDRGVLLLLFVSPRFLTLPKHAKGGACS